MTKTKIFMDQLKDKGFVVAMLVMLFGSIGYAYWHFVIDKNYTLVYHADCDPTMEVCYVWECDPEAIDEEEKCTGDPDEDTWYYKHLERLAKNVPECKADDEDCDAFACEIGEEGCTEVMCTKELAEIDEVVCSEPDVYNAEHPEELEEDEEGSYEMNEEEMMEEDEESADMGEGEVVAEEGDGGAELETMGDGSGGTVEETVEHNEMEGVVAPEDVGVDT